MQITKIEMMDKHKYRVYLNDEPAFWLYHSEAEELHLREGMDFSSQRQAEIEENVLKKRARLQCMTLLQQMDRTEQQLRQRMRQKEYPENVIDDALTYVKSYRYVDDLRYAQNYIRSRAESKSRQQITMDLLIRGVKKDQIDRAWQLADPIDEIAQILRWAEKKSFHPDTADVKETQKFYQFLLRKGFSFSNIKKALT